jgi:ubiquitin C-terminal hydrolase
VGAVAPEVRRRLMLEAVERRRAAEERRGRRVGHGPLQDFSCGGVSPFTGPGRVLGGREGVTGSVVDPSASMESRSLLRSPVHVAGPAVAGRASPGIAHHNFINGDGSSCFLNASLQALSSVVPFRTLLLEYRDEGMIAGQLNNLFSGMYRDCLDTSILRRSIGWEGTGQQDAQEFVNFLFRHLEHEIPEMDVSDTMMTHLQETIMCQSCDRQSIDKPVIPYYFVSVPVNRCARTLDDLLEIFCNQGEAPEGARCSRCGGHEISQFGMRFANIPPVISIQLMRFGFDKEAGKRFRLDNKIAIPTRLNVYRYLSPTLMHDFIGRNVMYSLASVVCHRGETPDGGHYVAYVRDIQDGKWYFCDDAHLFSESELHNPLSVEVADCSDFMNSGDSYLLFYAREEE